ncbi:uncharacterized protein SCHCODRAFT_02005441 [Schizophyllum commune H4-8]|uniref:uncharacterized protein n=1 Tax=Schizophyllum commune (strain H4-8 / FGSC 9210) TaxID=578458 RepID=UPI00215F3C50|nr:uncharacterized protein SCHCODRAFT_02005441 [Schizophyllum commune H4-8]KAI5899205.1 hypothetical protein SCHCODRAFT_02005441 [Schizophyllum commune H4-8]
MAQSQHATKSSIDAQLERFLEVDNIYNQSTLPGLQIQSTPPQAPYTIVLFTEKEEERVTVDPRALMLFTITVHGVKADMRWCAPRAVGASKHAIVVHNGVETTMLACPDHGERTLYIDLTTLEKMAKEVTITAKHGGNRWGEEQVVGLDIRAEVQAPPNPSPANSNALGTPPRRVFSSSPARRHPEPLPAISDPLPPPPVITFSDAPPRSTTPPGSPPIPPPFPATLSVDSALERAVERPDLRILTYYNEKREPVDAVGGMQRTKRRSERYTPYGPRPVKRAVYKVVSTAADGLTLAGGLLRGWADSYFGDVDQAGGLTHAV